MIRRNVYFYDQLNKLHYFITTEPYGWQRMRLFLKAGSGLPDEDSGGERSKLNSSAKN